MPPSAVTSDEKSTILVDMHSSGGKTVDNDDPAVIVKIPSSIKNIPSSAFQSEEMMMSDEDEEVEPRRPSIQTAKSLEHVVFTDKLTLDDDEDEATEPIKRRNSFSSCSNEFINNPMNKRSGFHGRLRRSSSDSSEFLRNLPKGFPARHAEQIYCREQRKAKRNFFKATKFSHELIQKCIDEEHNHDHHHHHHHNPEEADPDDDPALLLSKSQGVKLTKRIQFHEVTIREYPIIVGDNPGGRKGPPLTLAWEFLESVTVCLDMYEELRPSRRTFREMEMTSDRRERLLRELGFTRQEIQEGTKAANIGRNRRRQTNEFINSDANHEKLERFGRKVKHVLTLGRKKRKEQEFLKQHVPSYPRYNRISTN